MFSHDPMYGARGPKGLVWYIFSYAKGAKLGPGEPWPLWPPGSTTDYAEPFISFTNYAEQLLVQI